MRLEDAATVNLLSSQLGYDLSIGETTKQMATILSRPKHVAFVSTDVNKEIIGWIHAFHSLYIESLPFVEIGGLVVDEKHRGKGIGKALISEIKDWCVEQNILTIRLRTQVKRLDAHKFYTALNFTEVKEQKVFQLKLKAKKKRP